MLDYGCTSAHLPDLSNINWESTALVFPMFYNPDPENPPKAVEDTSSIQTIVLLDGSWKQTSRMLKRMPELIRLPRLEIAPASPPLPRIRHPYFEGGMCTMEAGIQALKPFMTEEQTEHLTQNYILWLDRVRQMSGLRMPLMPGQSFKEARKAQDEMDARST
jgi:DTW domain-containing protein YfiP